MARRILARWLVFACLAGLLAACNPADSNRADPVPANVNKGSDPTAGALACPFFPRILEFSASPAFLPQDQQTAIYFSLTLSGVAQGDLDGLAAWLDLGDVGGGQKNLVADGRVTETREGLRIQYETAIRPNGNGAKSAIVRVGACGDFVQEARAPLLAAPLLGVVFHPGTREVADQAADMADLGASLAKFWFPWSQVQPTLIRIDPDSGDVSGRPSPGLRLLEARDITAKMAQEAAFPEHGGRFAPWIDWQAADRIVDALVDAGLHPLPLVGDATLAPHVVLDATNRIRGAPEPVGWEELDCADGLCTGYAGIGREAYLGQIALHARAAAIRYADRVVLWNTENELNWTYVHVLFAGWRKGAAWFDADFLESLLATLHEAIRAGSPAALTTMNFNIHDPLWLVRLAQWRKHMDVVGLGAYPNYLFARPVLTELLTLSVQAAVAGAAGKPVMVLEAGYPTGPPERGYSQGLQDDFLRDALPGSLEHGAVGYLHFALDDFPDPPSPWDLKAVEHYWGLVDVAGRRKVAFDTFGQFASP